MLLSSLRRDGERRGSGREGEKIREAIPCISRLVWKWVFIRCTCSVFWLKFPVTGPIALSPSCGEHL